MHVARQADAGIRGDGVDGADGFTCMGAQGDGLHAADGGAGQLTGEWIG
ncbi:hypothetical protein [Pseudoduganella dura]|nr:hypothetical protein [Pseudoduganella dura]